MCNMYKVATVFELNYESDFAVRNPVNMGIRGKMDWSTLKL